MNISIRFIQRLLICTIFILYAAINIIVLSQSRNRNYVKEQRFLNQNGSESVSSVRYYDDLGLIEDIVTCGQNTMDIALHAYTEYDALGRKNRQWNVVPDDGTLSYMSKDSIESHAESMYADYRPFVSYKYDGLDRVSSVIRPGEAWMGKKQMTSYRGNSDNEVKFYLINESGTGIELIDHYPANKLLCSTSIDEDGIQKSVFTDMSGNAILESVGNEDPKYTYYIYDNIGRLRYVLSPKYQEEEDLDSFAYEYKYDGRNRLIESKNPGCPTIKYWYDKSDRLICVQDGVLRNCNYYRRFFYDKLGRQVIQCLSDAAPVSNNVYEAYFTHNTASGLGEGRQFCDYGYSIRYTGNSSHRLQNDENLQFNLINVEIINYYDSYLFLDLFQNKYSQTLLDSISALCSGFDSLDNIAITGCPSTFVSGQYINTSNESSILQGFQYDREGRVIGCGKICLENRLSLQRKKYTFCGDINQERTDEYMNRVGSVLNKLLSSRINYTYYPNSRLLHYVVLSLEDSSGYVLSDTIQNLEYDVFGHIIANHRSSTLADMNYEYDLLHGWVKGITSDGGFEQRLVRETHGTNPRFNGSIASMIWTMPGEDAHHRYTYSYDGMNRLTAATYSQTHTGIVPPPGGGLPGHLNSNGGETLLSLIPSLESTGLAEGDASTQGLGGIVIGPTLPIGSRIPNYSTQYSYDANSNITHLKRYGKNNYGMYAIIDDVSVEYDGNQKTNATDAAANLTYSGASDFVDVNIPDSTDYDYTENGALKRDLNRGIANIEYDLLGNERRITFSNSNQIEYVYSADGRRLRASHKTKIRNFQKTDSTDYCDNLILKNGSLSKYLFDGGYVSFKADTICGLHYYVQDYMGNNRMVVDGRADTIEQKTHYYPYGGVIGDLSTNQSIQSFKFEGKELDRSFGLDWYDIHARQYDAIGVPGWNKPDPLADKYYSISPYSYCGGDPVNKMDLTGMDTYYVNSIGQVRLALKTEEDYDELVSESGEKTKLSDQTILSQLSSNSHKNGDGTSTIWANSALNSEMIGLLYFLHDNTNIEWSMSKYSDGSSTIGAYMGYNPKGDEVGSSPASYANIDGHAPTQEKKHIHSHIDNVLPSGSYTIFGEDGKWNYDMNKAPVRTRSDQWVYENKYNNVFNRDINKMPLHYVLYKNNITKYSFWTANIKTINRNNFIW